MPTRPNLGYASAMGVAGGFESLHQLIAARQKQEEEAQLQRLRDEAAALAARRLDEDVAFRQTQQAQQVMDRDERRSFQEAQLERLRANDALVAENRDIDNYRAALDSMAGGTVFDEQGYQRAVKAGYGPAFKRRMAEHPLAPAQYEFAGGREWQTREADRKSREEQKQLDREREARAEANRIADRQLARELAAEARDEAGWTKVEDLTSPSGLSWVNPRKPTEKRPVAGDVLLGPPSARASKDAEDIIPFISSLNALERVGRENNWQGMGITGGIRAGLQSWGLTSPPAGEVAVRSALGDVRSFIAHQRYGAALTEGEKEILNTFIANVETQGKGVTEQMIKTVRDIELNVMRDLMSGVRKVYLTERPAGGTPTVTGVTPYTDTGSALRVVGITPR